MIFEPQGPEAVVFLALPPKLFFLYCEIFHAYLNERDLLCCAGLRMLLEGICNDKGIARYYDHSFRDMSLSDRVASLKPYTEGCYIPWTHLNLTNSGLIDFLGWFVNKMANPAIHDLRQPDNRSTLTHVIMVIEQWLLPALYPHA